MNTVNAAHSVALTTHGPGLNITHQGIENRVFDLLLRLRERFAERTGEVNAMTEREVMRAADSVAQIVDVAGGHVARVKDALSVLRGGGKSVGIATLVRRQIDAIDQYTREVRDRANRQQTDALEAAARTRDITRAARSIAALSQEAHILALNARIEAGRLSERGASFRVIAGEMQRLSKTIASTNELIDTLSRDLTALLPKIAESADGMLGHASEFSVSFAASAREVEEGTEEMHRYVADALEHGDASLARVVVHSHETLSHLQFQDAVAQGLLRIDGWMRETQLETAAPLDLEERNGEIAANIHAEIGGDKGVDVEIAGDVLLF